VLRAREPAKIKAVSAALALARRGLSMLRAKRVVEAVLSGGEAVVHVPMVEDFATLAAELKAAGLRATKTATAPVDVRKIRIDLSMTQEEFAALFNLDLDTVQNWEQGRRRLDRTAESYLRVIAREHKAAARAQEESES
jgi:putative transcriptional regulator